MSDSNLTSDDRAALRAFPPRFRGQVYDMDIGDESVAQYLRCHFHRPMLRKSILPTTRRIGCRAANQIGKTRAGELMMIYRWRYTPADTVIYDWTEMKRDDHIFNRLLPWLKKVPQIGAIMQAMMETPNGRHEIGKKGVKFPGMIFRACPLNETWVQSFPVSIGMISDAALSGNDNIIERAFVRSTQNRNAEFWYIESQGGLLNAGEPFDNFEKFMRTTNEMKLHVRCQECGTRIRFKFNHERNEQTEIVAPLSIPSLDRDAWISHHRAILISEKRRHCGFKHADGIFNLEDGTLNESAIVQTTVYECPACGSEWRDTPNTRRYLDMEAGLDENWIPDRPTANPANPGYSIPIWINPKPDIHWGDQMLAFRNATLAMRARNFQPMQDFDTKICGESWDVRKSTATSIPVAPGSYDPNKIVADEASRDMAIDCQENLDHKAKTGQSITGWFWYVARVYDMRSNSWQLARGYAKSIEDVVAVQHRWKIPNDRVCIDVQHWPQQVKALACRFREERARIRPHVLFGMRPEMVTWKLFQTENKRFSFKHEDHIVRPYSPQLDETMNFQTPEGNWIRVPLVKIRFDKTVAMQQMDLIRSSGGADGAPKFEVLGRSELKLPNGEPDTLTLNEERGMRTYENQMNAQEFDVARNAYVEMRPDDHYRWCEQALMVRQWMDSKLGRQGIYEPPQQTE